MCIRDRLFLVLAEDAIICVIGAIIGIGLALFLFFGGGLQDSLYSFFGDIVFNLVDFGILGRTENDSLDDFEDGYNFKDAFEQPFLPKDLENN